MVKCIVVALFVLLSAVAAAEGTLQEKIARLQEAPAEQRYRLMNEIKRELAQMNARQRSEALRKLRSAMHAKGNTEGKGGHRGMAHRGGQMHGKNSAQHTPMQQMHREQMLQVPQRMHPDHMPMRQGGGVPHR